jgi:transposase
MSVQPKISKKLVKSDCTLSPAFDKRYSYHEFSSEYGGNKQKWSMYHSDPMHKRQNKTFEKNLVKNLCKRIQM